jgi:hypothetical protein
MSAFYDANTPTRLELPAKVIDSIEAYEKRTGVDRSSLLSLALKAQKDRLDDAPCSG